MANMTLALPAELKSRMDQFPELNWSEVARQAFEQKMKDLEFLKRFSEKSTITQKEALKLGRDLNKNLASR